MSLIPEMKRLLRTQEARKAHTAKRRIKRANGEPVTCKRCGSTYPDGQRCAFCDGEAR